MSCLARSAHNPHNHLLAGDKFGNLYLLDLSKKTQIAKRDAVPGKRITQICALTVPYAEQHLTTVAVVARAEGKVNIYRYLSSEHRLHQNFSIQICQVL
jgi:hypothetical protein